MKTNKWEGFVNPGMGLQGGGGGGGPPKKKLNQEEMMRALEGGDDEGGDHEDDNDDENEKRARSSSESPQTPAKRHRHQEEETPSGIEGAGLRGQDTSKNLKSRLARRRDDETIPDSPEEAVSIPQVKQ